MVKVKKGFSKNIETQKVYPDDNGIITVETRELERVVIHLDDIRDEIEIEKKGKDNSKFNIQHSTFFILTASILFQNFGP